METAALGCFTPAAALSVARTRISLEDLHGLLVWDGLMTLWTVRFQPNYESTKSFFFSSNTIRHRLYWTADNWEKRLLRKHSCSFSLYCWLNVIYGDATHACLISVLWPYFTLVLFPLPALTLLSMLFVNECLFTSVICICMPGTVVVPVGWRIPLPSLQDS